MEIPQVGGSPVTGCSSSREAWNGNQAPTFQALVGVRQGSRHPSASYILAVALQNGFPAADAVAAAAAAVAAIVGRAANAVKAVKATAVEGGEAEDDGGHGGYSTF